MRYVVLLALFTSGLSGFALMGLRGGRRGWQTRMAAKAGLWALAFAVFAYVSWVYWPRRVFATKAEWPGVVAQGLALSLVMIGHRGAGDAAGAVGPGLTGQPHRLPPVRGRLRLPASP